MYTALERIICLGIYNVNTIFRQKCLNRRVGSVMPGRRLKLKSKFGRLLEAYRSFRGVTQTELRDLLEEVGYFISVSAINKYELGRREPTPEFVYRVSQVLDLKADEVDALINAHFVDQQSYFLSKYRDILSKETTSSSGKLDSES